GAGSRGAACRAHRAARVVDRAQHRPR
ncbi:MAG: hypothetical protein AVDCRST_MAG85-1999, partial [uncultured Solirubrobacteraceae bacterium]